MVKDYIDTNDFTKEELLGMVDLAIAMKGLIKEGGEYPLLLKNRLRPPPSAWASRPRPRSARRPVRLRRPRAT